MSILLDKHEGGYEVDVEIMLGALVMLPKPDPTPTGIPG